MKTTVLFIVLLAFCGAPSQAAAPTKPIVELHNTQSWKVPLPGHGELESWASVMRFNTKLEDTKITSLRAHLLSKGKLQKTLLYTQSGLAALVQNSWPAQVGFNVEILFQEPQVLAINSVQVEYELTSAGEKFSGVLEFHVGEYELNNSYIFPLSGNGLLTAGFFNTGGHLSRATLFAVDVIGVNESYAAMKDSVGDKNESLVGWGRKIIAPADGKVIFVQNNVKDQPYGTYDEESFKLANGESAHWGNAIIIDHGNNEYGVLMHMQEKSITVSVGDLVKQGQVVGLLGNSGDSNAPHLHFHLQDGPEMLRGFGLPPSFSDVTLKFLRKGEWIIRK